MKKLITPRLLYCIFVVVLVSVGCSSNAITPTPITCNGYSVISDSLPTCITDGDHTLIQTPLNQQIQLEAEDLNITLNGTAVLHITDSTQTLISIEGTLILGINQQIQTVQSGQQIIVDSQTRQTHITNYQYADLQTLSFEKLQRPITLIEPTSTPIASSTPDIDCPPPENWTDTYIIQSGDSLTSIANQANITVQELQTANCIENPNSIQVGQRLIVPANAIPATQPAQTFTPSAVFFRADNESLINGDCTTLRWDVQNIRQLTLDGDLITTTTSQQVCPTTTTTYSLIVDYHDDRQTEHTITITVTDT